MEYFMFGAIGELTPTVLLNMGIYHSIGFLMSVGYLIYEIYWAKIPKKDRITPFFILAWTIIWPIFILIGVLVLLHNVLVKIGCSGEECKFWKKD